MVSHEFRPSYAGIALASSAVVRKLLSLLLLMLTGGCCSSLAKLVDPSRAVAPHASSYSPPAGSYAVEESSAIWHDPARDRDVPVKIYAPAGVSNPPVVIFSHGIGEDRDSYAYLGRAWAAHGYAAIHVTHAGTDKATLRQGYLKLYRATKDPRNWMNRPRDVSFVLDQLARHAPGAPPVDLDRVAVAGHSAGAFTALAITGMGAGSGEESLADPRVKVAIALSMPKMGTVIPPGGYDSLHAPTLHMTGTCDGSLIYRTRPADRRIPFESTHAPRQYLVTLAGVNHNTFSNTTDPHHARIAALTTAFLDAFLRNDDAARSWLDDGGAVAWAGGELAEERK
jgi:predicted dienelactone hydrolase